MTSLIASLEVDMTNLCVHQDPREACCGWQHTCCYSHSRDSYCFLLLVLCAGATDAARGAADIVLTRPGLSVIVSAIIGARKIFQRMTTYSKYTVAMTFRICFTFGLLTVIYNW